MAAAVPAFNSLADQADGLGGLGEHDGEPGEDIAGGCGGDGRVGAGLGAVRAAGYQPRVGGKPGGPGDWANESERARLFGGQAAGHLKPVNERVGAEQGVGGALELTVGAGQVGADRVRVGTSRRRPGRSRRTGSGGRTRGRSA